jgi:hypothetical protein
LQFRKRFTSRGTLEPCEGGPEYTKRPNKVRFNLHDIVIDIPVEYDIDDLNLIRLNTGDQALRACSELVVTIEELNGSILIDSGASKRSYISQCFVIKLLVVKICFIKILSTILFLN